MVERKTLSSGNAEYWAALRKEKINDITLNFNKQDIDLQNEIIKIGAARLIDSIYNTADKKQKAINAKEISLAREKRISKNKMLTELFNQLLESDNLDEIKIIKAKIKELQAK